MKFSVTLSDLTESDFARLSAILTNGNSPATTATTNVADDESGEPDANAPERDSSGIPWDARIHSANKKTNADGKWKRKRGISDAEFTTIENSLRTPQIVPPAAPVAPQIMPPAAPVAPQIVPPAAPVAPQIVPPAPSFTMPQIPQPDPNFTPPQFLQPAAPAAPASMDFNGFMGVLQKGFQTANTATGQAYIDPEYLNSLTTYLSQISGRQIANITDLVQHPDLLPHAISRIQSENRWPG